MLEEEQTLANADIKMDNKSQKADIRDSVK